MYRILAINPGATSTKISLYENKKELFVEAIRHTVEELKPYSHPIEEYHFRAGIIEKILDDRGVRLNELSAVVGRGGPFKPLESGTYAVSEKMKNDVREGRVQADHISNIGCLLASELAEKVGIPAYIVDPVSVDEFIPEARVSGMKEITRQSLAHALNIKMVGKKHAAKVGKRYNEMNLVIAHLGGGITISSHEKGRMIDVNNANDEGPFSPQRSGTLPITQLAKLCYSGKYPDYNTMKKHLIKQGGMHSLLGLEDLRDVIAEIEKGNEDALLYFNAMGYQIIKYIGAYAAVLKGKVNSILITGGIAYNERMMKMIREGVEWIAPVHIYPGEDEMEGLTLGALRVLRGEEEVCEY